MKSRSSFEIEFISVLIFALYNCEMKNCITLWTLCMELRIKIFIVHSKKFKNIPFIHYHYSHSEINKYGWKEGVNTKQKNRINSSSYYADPEAVFRRCLFLFQFPSLVTRICSLGPTPFRTQHIPTCPKYVVMCLLQQQPSSIELRWIFTENNISISKSKWPNMNHFLRCVGYFSRTLQRISYSSIPTRSFSSCKIHQCSKRLFMFQSSAA